MPIIRIGRMDGTLPITIDAGSHVQFWGDTQQPYGTHHSGLQNVPFVNQLIGKESRTAGGGFIDRGRAGMYFAIPSSLAGYTTALLKFKTNTGRNTLETFRPAIYASNTDDSAFTLGWQDNVNVLCGYGVYDSAVSPVHQQAVPVTFSAVLAQAGAHLSLILGNEFELLGTGVGISGNANADFMFTVGIGQISLVIS